MLGRHLGAGNLVGYLRVLVMVKPTETDGSSSRLKPPSINFSFLGTAVWTRW